MLHGQPLRKRSRGTRVTGQRRSIDVQLAGWGRGQLRRREHAGGLGTEERVRKKARFTVTVEEWLLRNDLQRSESEAQRQHKRGRRLHMHWRHKLQRRRRPWQCWKGSERHRPRVASAIARATTRKGHTTADRSKGSGQTSFTFMVKKRSSLCGARKQRSPSSRGRRILSMAKERNFIDVGTEGPSKQARRHDSGRNQCPTLRSADGAHVERSIDTLLVAGNWSGLGEWRRLHRGYDLGTARRFSGFLSRDFEPTQEFNRELAASHWEPRRQSPQVLRERDVIRGHTGAKLPLQEEIRIASLEALLPDDVESHIQNNSSRLVDYATSRSEVVLCEPPVEFAKSRFMILWTHPFLASTEQGNARRANPNARAQPTVGGGVCYNFGESQTPSRRLLERPQNYRPKQQHDDKTRNPESWTCGKKGHLARTCWVSSIPSKPTKG